MNFKPFFKPIYLVIVTLIYGVAVAIILASIVIFAILHEISKSIKPLKKGKPKKVIVYRTFKPIKPQGITAQHEQFWNRF